MSARRGAALLRSYDSLEVLIGIQNIPSGMVGVDLVILNKTGP
jgi:hypothetical protein